MPLKITRPRAARSQASRSDIPDPYGQKDKAYETALDMIEDGCRGLAAFVTKVPAPR
jgi:protein-tyrosine-phosphatase